MKKNILLTTTCFLISMVNASMAQTSGDYRTKQSGIWNAKSSWETFNGTTWIDATVAPSSSNGVITILSGDTITSGGGVTADQLVISSGGTLSITSATYTLADGPGTDLNCSGTLSFSGTNFDGAGLVEVKSGGTFNWTGGTFKGTGVLTLEAGSITSVSTGDHYISDTRTINNYGTLTWSGGILYYKTTSPAINNYGIFNIYTDADITNSGNVGTGTFNNKSGGTINKTGVNPEETSFANIGTFTNDGTINITSGTINITVNSTHIGKLNPSAGTAVRFTGTTTANFNAGSTFTGAGNINFEGATVTINAIPSISCIFNLISGTLSINQAIIMSNGSTINQSGGTLNGTSTITFNSGSTFNWTGGTNGGSGTLTIKSGGNFNINGGNVFLADTKTISNSGTCSWTSGNIYFNGGSSPILTNSGTFNINTTGDVFYSGSISTGTITNKSAGVINKIGSPINETSFEGFSLFTNEGTLNIDSGAINFKISFTQSGVINVALGATMRLTAGTATLKTGTTFTGAGSANFEGANTTFNTGASITTGTINVFAGTLTVKENITRGAGSTFNLSGTLDGTSAITLNSGSTFNWTGGTIGGSSSIEINSGANFTLGAGTGYVLLSDTKIINNYGTWTWTSGDLVYNTTSPAINNYGTFNINTDANVRYYYFSPNDGTFTNKSSGIINKTGIATDDTYFNGISTFTNEGTINVNSGTMRIYPNSTNSGTINVASGAYMSFAGGTANFTAGSSFGGLGNSKFDGAIATINASASLTTSIINVSLQSLTINASASFAANTINVSGGTFTLNPAITMGAGSTINISGGTFNLNPAFTAGAGCTVSLSGGALNTISPITFDSGSTFNWAGTNGGSGVMNINSGANVNLNGTGVVSDNKVINNYGTWTWTGGDLLYTGTNPAINNYGTFNIYTNNSISYSGSITNGTFTNKSTGIINKIGSPFTNTNIGGISTFTNEGTINVNSGKINIQINSTHTGSITVASAAIMGFSGGTANFNAGSVLTGAGSANFEGSTVALLNTSASLSTNTVNILGGTVTITPEVTMNSGGVFNMSGGTLNGASTITFQSGSSFNWTGGTNSGSGTININEGASVTMSSCFLADTKTINNYGIWSLTGSLTYNTGSTPVVNNYGELNIINSNTLAKIVSSGSNGTFNNKTGGIINKSGVETSFSGFSAFTNEGTINVNSGNFNISVNSTHLGIINVTYGALMQFIGTTTTNFNTGSAFTGPGVIHFGGATAAINTSLSVSMSTINLSAGSLTINQSLTMTSGSIFNLSGGTLNGSSTVTFNSGTTFNWTGGYNAGSGVININAGAIFSMSGSYYYYLTETKTINNYGTWTWSSGYYWYNGSTNPVVNNYGTFNINTDADIAYSGSNTGTFTNKSTGIINKTGSPSDETSFSGFSSFTNEGAINVNSGRLTMSLNSSHTGSITVALGATVRFTGGTTTSFNAGSTLSGAGSTNFEASAVAINASASVTTNTLNVFSGCGLTINTSATIVASAINLYGGTFTLDPALTLSTGSTFNFSGGTLNGAGTITFESGSTFNWTGGTNGGSGVMNINDGATFTMNISSSYIYLADTKIINNYGTWTWTGSGILIYKTTSPAVNNYGTFNINTDGDVGYYSYGSTGIFDNKPGGIINKAGSPSDETSFSSIGIFTNEGTINVNSGKIALSDNSTHTGSINVALGATISFGTVTFNAGSSLSGEGTGNFGGGGAINASASLSINTFNFSGGTLSITPIITRISGSTFNFSGGTLNGAGTITFESGSTFNWTGGTNGGSGIMNINEGATFTMNSSSYLYIADTKTINNYGMWTWTSGILLYKTTNPTLNNYGTFNINTDGDVGYYNYGSTGIFANKPGGIINKAGSPSDETSFSSIGTFTNEGTININSGNLTLNVSGTHNGNYNIAISTELRGGINMPFAGAIFTNNGKVTLSTLTFSGLSSQTLAGTGSINTLTINNPNGINLDGSQTINTVLNLTSGKITLGNVDLLMGTAALNGGSAASYILSSGTGSLRRTVSTNALFPVGHSSSYMPVNIQLTAGPADDFKVRVLPDIYSSYDGSNNPIGNAVNSNSVNGTWIISENTPGSSTATITLQWNLTDEASGFDRSNSRFGHFTGGDWVLDPILAASGSNPYTLTSTGITTFSPFGIINKFITCINTYEPLCAGSSVNVPYISVGMNAGNKFTAQLSNASGSFSPPVNIGTLNSATSGTINATIPVGTTPGTGYRIRVKSNDPAFTGPDNGSSISIGINKKYFQDSDNDTYGNQSVSQVSCSIPLGYVPDSTDCNDGNINIHPGATEICNNIDDNCISGVDEGVNTTYYADADGDGYGNLAISQSACSQPLNYVTNGTDCNDGNPAIHPNAPEICNGIDDNCIGGQDEAIAIYHYTDNTSGIPNSVSANATATNLLRVNGTGVPSFPCSNGGFSSKNFSNVVTFSNTLPAIEFTITPAAGFQLQVTSFSSDLRRSSSGPANVRYAYSLNNGVTWIDQGADDSLDYSVCGIMTTYTWDFVDFSTTQSLKFRIYGFNASSISGILQLMNVNLNGQVCPAALDADGDGYEASVDCDDNNEDINPGEVDICNGIDDNCANGIDENAITAAITPSGSVSTCSGTELILTANSGAATYQWLKNGANISGATNITYSTSKAADYQVWETNIFSCSDTSVATTITVNSNPTATITPQGDLDICVAGSVVLQANTGTGLKYKWKKDGANISGATNSSYTATVIGVYKVTVTDNSTGCKKTSAGKTVTKSCKEALTENSNPADAFKIYPNPTAGKFIIELTTDASQNETATIEVMNMIGQIVFTGNELVTNGKLLKQISMDNAIAEGMYLVRVIFDNKIYTEQVVYQQ